MEVWIVLRDWEEDIDEYGTHHNDKCGSPDAQGVMTGRYWQPCT